VLFLVRWPGSLLALVPLLIAGYVVVIFFTYAFAGNLDTPSVGLAAHYGIYLLVGRALDLTLALGLAALISSRGITIGVLLAWSFAIGPILASITLFGVFREFVSTAATDAIRPVLQDNTHIAPESLGAAILVIVVYCAVFLAVGAWRTATMDA